MLLAKLSARFKEMVLSAYASSGYKPTQGFWCDPESKRCCAAGALIIGNTSMDHPVDIIKKVMVAEFPTIKPMNLHHFISGVVDGFDHPTGTTYHTSTYFQVGHMTGKKIWEETTSAIPK
jgi:hypothetical protein